MLKIAIIGSSQCENVTLEDWCAMKIQITDLIKTLLKEDRRLTLVSGGSSWSDHLAVELYKEIPNCNLILHLPAEMLNGKYKDSTHCGRELNKRHAKFSQALYSDGDKTLKELHDLTLPPRVNYLSKEKGTRDRAVTIQVTPGFLQRNSLVAKDADYLIAVTNEVTITGGTLDTWNKFSRIKPNGNKHQVVW